MCAFRNGPTTPRLLGVVIGTISTLNAWLRYTTLVGWVTRSRCYSLCGIAYDPKSAKISPLSTESETLSPYPFDTLSVVTAATTGGTSRVGRRKRFDFDNH